MIRTTLGTLVLTLVLMGEAAAVTPISSCQTLSAPGTYRLTTNLSAGTDADCLVVASTPRVTARSSSRREASWPTTRC